MSNEEVEISGLELESHTDDGWLKLCVHGSDHAECELTRSDTRIDKGDAEELIAHLQKVFKLPSAKALEARVAELENHLHGVNPYRWPTHNRNI